MNKYRIIRRELRNPETYEIKTYYVIQKFSPRISVWFITIEKENWFDILENRYYTKTYKTFEEADKMLSKLKIPLLPDVVGKNGGGGMDYNHFVSFKPIEIKIGNKKSPVEKEANRLAIKFSKKIDKLQKIETITGTPKKLEIWKQVKKLKIKSKKTK